MKAPDFKGEENAMPYVIWNLYNRVCDAVKSFVVLLENKHYYDSFIIAGHALETCAILSYIKDNDTLEQQTENYNIYLAGSAVLRLLDILDTEETLEKIFHGWFMQVC